MPSVLITGASGFIGSFLAEEGLKRGFDVYAAVRPSSSRRYLADHRIRFVEMNTSARKRSLPHLPSCRDSGIRFDFIIHNAGITKAKKPGDFMRVNRDLTIQFITGAEGDRHGP